MGQGCWCSCVVKLRPSEAAIQGWYEKKYTRGMKLKVFPFDLTQFLVNNLFYTWTFIKTEFLCIYALHAVNI